MKTTIKLWVIALCASMPFLSSCLQDEIINESKLNLTNQTGQKTKLSKEGILIPSTARVIDANSARTESTEVDEFAKLLASSLKNEEMRTFLKDEANKKFDGDYDILVSNVLDAGIGGETFSDVVKDNDDNDNTNARTNNAFDAATENPKLNIAIPVLIEDWNDETQQPLVAVAMGAIEGETKFLKAYDSNGTEYLLDADTEPDVPVIVIANNERMGEDFQETRESTANARISGNMEKITYLKCPNLKKIESWYFGGPEIRFDGVVYNSNSGAAIQAFKKTQNPSRDMAKHGYTLTQDLFNWYYDTHQGPDYYIQSSEIDDSGATYKVSVSVTAGKKDVVSGTVGFEISYTAQDKELAGELIHYQSATPKTISDSYIVFKLTN